MGRKKGRKKEGRRKKKVGRKKVGKGKDGGREGGRTRDICPDKDYRDPDTEVEPAEER